MSQNSKNNNVFSPLGSSNHSINDRQSEDYYATDKRAINHLLEKEPQLNNISFKVLEPCAGEGILNDAWYDIVGTKMDMYDLISRRDDIIEANYFNKDFSNQYDLIITNPPYAKGSKTKPGLADLIVKSLFEVKENGYVCMFLKTLHLESKERYEKIFKNYPPTRLHVYSPRISCYKNNDTSLPQGAISYTWFVWHKLTEMNFEGPTILDWIYYK